MSDKIKEYALRYVGNQLRCAEESLLKGRGKKNR